MDNADLEKLSVSPGKLTPKFNPNTTEYAVMLASDVEKIKINPLTSDSGASYSISGSDGGKTVLLKEGEVTSIKVEVTAEDGRTVKNYFIYVTRLSPSDASLSGLELSTASNLSPKFASNVTSYSVNVPFSCSSVRVTPVVADKKTVVRIKGNESEGIVGLNFGESLVKVEVTSPDGSNQQTYTLLITRSKIPRAINFLEEKYQSKFTCPVCLGILYRPKSMKHYDVKHTFCKSCIDELTRTSKHNPLDGSPLKRDWRMEQYDVDEDLSSQTVFCVYKHWGCSATLKLCELGYHVKHCDFRPFVVEKSEEMVPLKDLEEKSKEACKGCPDCNRSVRRFEMEEHQTFLCTSKHPISALKHKAEIRVWEKKLHQETSERSIEKLIGIADKQIKECFKVLPQHGNAGNFDGDISPLRFLEMASEWFASAIKLSPKKAELHFQLAQVLEEQHYIQDLYGIKPPKSSDAEEMDFNMKSMESSKEDDVQAICEMRGAGRNAPLALQLKAIDEEYHYLLDQGRSDRADYVQKLYLWKSKQVTQNKTAQLARDEEEPLGKAFLKYLDALYWGSDHHLYNLHVGRMLLMQNKPEEALTRLQISVGLKPTNIEARFYLGLALGQQKDTSCKRRAEAVKYLSEGVEFLLKKMTDDSDDPSINLNKWQQTSLSSNNLMRLDNVQWLQGCALLGSICENLPNVPCGVMPSQTYLYLSSMLACDLMARLVARGDTYHQVEWVLFESHFKLLQVMLNRTKGKQCEQNRNISHFCENLSSLLKYCSTIPPGKQILELQEKTCQQAVLLEPCNSQALYRLGDAQLSCYDNDDPTSTKAKQILHDAELSYRGSIEQEGSPSIGGDPSSKIVEQLWFRERKAKQEAEKKPPTGASQKAAASASSKGTTPVGRGVVAPSQGRAAVARGKGRTPPSRAAGAAKTPSGRSRGKISPTKPTTAPARGAARGGSRMTTAPPTKSSTSTTSHKSGCCSPTKQTTSVQTPTVKTVVKPPATPTSDKPAEPEKASGALNKATYHPRLGLARVLMRKGGDDISEAHKLYEEVISMAPIIYDAYIELADSLVKLDAMKAVDIYSKYPYEEPLTFDDAYLHGEIVCLLMKNGKFDDPRLGPSMISLGKVMGLTVLEKHVDTLDKTFKYSKLLMEVYAGVHGKSLDDPDLKQFFKFKCWL